MSSSYCTSIRSTAIPEAAMTALASWPAARIRCSSAAASRPFSMTFSVCTMSCRRSASTQPSADVMPGNRGTKRGLQPDLADQRADVQRAAAAERHGDETSRIVAAFDRDEPDRAGHAGVGDLHDRCRRRRGVETERRADMRRDGAFGRFDIERFQPAAERARRVDAAEHDLGIGQRRPRVALAVAHGSGHRAGAFRADLEQAAAIDRGDRAAAGSDRGDLDHRACG